MFVPKRIYCASSWRNHLQIGVVAVLRAAGHEAYDFREPVPGGSGFSWREIDPDWLRWSPKQYREALRHPIAQEGFRADFAAMQWADCCVLILPCGRSAHLEAGWFTGQGKPVWMLLLEQQEPELMALLSPLGADCILTSMDDLFDALGCKE